jgi:receptor protein-tyrosine kinase
MAAQSGHGSHGGGNTPFELTGFLPIVKRSWWLLALSAIVAGFVGYLASSSAAPRYESRVELLVGPITADLETQRAAGVNAQTYAQFATSRQILQATITELGLPMTPGELGAVVSATADDVTRFVTVRAQDAEPEVAARIANGLAQNLVELTSRGTVRPEGELTVIDPALTGEQISANNTLIVILSAFAGVLGAFALILLAEYLRGTVRNDRELSELTGVPFLGAVSSRRTHGNGVTLVDAKPTSRAAAAYRFLAAEIEFSRRERPPSTVLVASTQRGDGGGTLAANLAATFARNGRRVMLVDADSLDAEATGVLQVEAYPGLGELLRTGSANTDGDVIYFRSPDARNLSILPPGNLDGVGSLPLERVQELFEQLSEGRDLVIIAGGSIQESPTTLTFARAAEATVLVAARERTKRTSVSDAIESLRLVGATLIGAVLTENRFVRGRLFGPGGAFSQGRGQPNWQRVDSHPEPTAFPGGAGAEDPVRNGSPAPEGVRSVPRAVADGETAAGGR